MEDENNLNTINEADKELLGNNGMWLDNDTISVLLEAASVLLDNQWSEQYQMYEMTHIDKRHGHPFEHLMRLKRLVNELTCDIRGGYGSLGCCSHCKGNDGNYVQHKSWWGFCRLCEVRWLIGDVQIDDRIAPMLNNPWVEDMQANYHEVPLYVSG